jgi:hypothetical protein
LDTIGRAVRDHETALTKLVDDPAGEVEATIRNNLGVARMQMARLGDKPAANLKTAISVLTRARDLAKDHEPPIKDLIAAISGNLGDAYRELAVYEDRAQNIARAREALTAAITTALGARDRMLVDQV